MSVLYFLSKSRGIRNLFSRITTVLRRFGISSNKFEKLLKRYCDVTREAGIVPTFAITAVILARHANCVRELSHQGIEFAVHGYVHIDYKLLPLEEQVKHYKKAIETFEYCQIPFTGFRAPFLRVNGTTPEVLGNLGFRYDSSHIIHWDAVDLTKCSTYARRNHDQLLKFYQPRKAQEYLALPRSVNSFIEIPVSKILNKKNKSHLNFTRVGVKIKAPCYLINKNKIWGATAMILSEFVEILNQIDNSNL